MRPCLRCLALLLALSLTACSAPEPGDRPAAFDQTAWRQEITEWQVERQASMSDPEGWRALVGLDWLEPGETTVGGGADNDVILTTDNAPPRIGTLIVESQTDGEAPEVRFRPAQGVEVTANGEPVHGEVTLATDLEDDPTVLEVGSLALHVIARTKDKDIRLALRSRDREAPGLADPPQLTFYPADPAWRLQARFEPYDPPRQNRIVNILGMTSWEPCPGALVFEKDGKQYRLDTLDDNDQLFVIFFDRTNSDTTYGSGRYLYTDKPTDDNRVILDFNRAYHPPCAFTDFATCPLPPPQNRLPIAVTAGERYDPSYGGH